MLNGLVQLVMLAYFFVLRAKFYKALKQNRLIEFYRANCGIRASVVMFSLFYWLHCTLSILDGIWGALEFINIQYRKHITMHYVDMWRETEYVLLASEVLNLWTMAFCIFFFYLLADNVKKAETYIRGLYSKKQRE